MPATGDLILPGYIGAYTVASGVLNSHTIGATTSQAEWIFSAVEDATIVDLGFRYTAKGAGVPPTYTISLQTVSAGVPTGTVLASGTFTPPNDATWNNTYRWVALSASVNISRGVRYAIVISTSGTANSDQFTVSASGVGYNLPRAINNTTGTRSPQNPPPIFGYRSASRTYGFPLQAVTALSYGTGASPNDFGVSFNLPSNLFSTYQVQGVLGILNVANTTGNVIFSLETTGGTVLQSITIPKADILSTTRRSSLVNFSGTTLATLNAGTEYYLFIRSDDTNAIGPVTMDFASANDAAATPGGSNFALVSRTSGGAVTKTTTRRLSLDLIVSDITPPAGGGTPVFVLEG